MENSSAKFYSFIDSTNRSGYTKNVNYFEMRILTFQTKNSNITGMLKIYIYMTIPIFLYLQITLSGANYIFFISIKDFRE